jgi:PAS domain S-box-containing protein
MLPTPAPSAPAPPARRVSWGLPVGALAFGLTALLGRASVLEGEAAALVWPAAGVAVLWLLLRGAGPLSLDVLAMALVTVLVNVLTGASWPLILVFVVTNVGHAVVLVALLRRFLGHLWGCGGTEPLATLRDLSVLAWTSLGASILAAVVGVVGVALADGAPVTLEALTLWCGRVLAGTLVVGSAGLLTAAELSAPRAHPLRELRGRAREALALVAATAAVHLLAFSLDLPLAFTLLAPTVWAAKRFTTVTTTWHTLAGAGSAVLLTLRGHGPFAPVPDPAQAAMLVQLLVVLMSLLGLFVAIARDERTALVERLALAHEASDRQAQLLRSMVDAMHEGVTVVGADGRVTLQNPAGAELLGVEHLARSDDVAPAVSLPDGAPVPAAHRPSLRALAGEAVRDEDYLVRHPDGSTRRIRVSATPLPPLTERDENQAVLVFRDVTEDVEREAALQAYAGTVAHDLHNPLAAIVGWNAIMLNQLESGEVDEQQLRGLCVRLGSSADRLHELIEGLLEHASSKDRTLELTRVDLGGLLHRITESRGVEDLVHGTDLPAVRADLLLAGQLLDNLVGNALKYVADGVTPDVRVSARTDRPGWVTVSVADNGIGIPDGQHEAVFDEFHRAHAGYQGSGLGLSIVQRIVTRHGGSIHALPAPTGRGTVFEFTLPAA